MTINDQAVLIDITRGPVIESIHRGHIAVVDSENRLLAYSGNPDYYTYARSTAKLIQAIPLLEAGGAERFGLTPEETALLCASHNGEPEHARTALALLQRLGLDENALSCGPQEPTFKPAADALKWNHAPATALHNNCSGKHAGMLALAQLLGVPYEGYHLPEHPVQQLMLDTVSAMSGVAREQIALGVDGCGVPVFAMPLRALALAYARLGRPNDLPPERQRACLQLIDAIRRKPYYVAGTGRYDSLLAEVTGGRIIGKMGAEGVYCATAAGEGIGVALKIDDGAERALYAAATEALVQCGLLRADEASALAPFHRPVVENRRGEPVGEIRPAFTLTRL